MRKLVIIPTYNEKENISAMIDKVFSLPEPFEMLVIDDGSPDGTAAIVKERRKEFPERLHLMERAGKLGLGTAYLAGFRWGLENGFDYICEMDCDFSHNPDDLVRLCRAAEQGGDVVVGSRYVEGVNVVNWPMSRLLMSYFASKYVRLVTGLPLHDARRGGEKDRTRGRDRRARIHVLGRRGARPHSLAGQRHAEGRHPHALCPGPARA